MTAILLGRFPADSPEWHQARATRIGGSDVGVLMGWSHFQTRDELLAHKQGTTAPKEPTAAMLRGKYLEPAIRDWFCDTTNNPVADTGGSYVDSDNDWMLANVDAFLTDDTLLEVKTAKEKAAEHGWGRAGTDQIPLAYAAQCTWYMGITGRHMCHVAVLFGAPFAFAKYKVRFDADVFNVLRREAAAFHHELTTNPLGAAA